MKHDQSRQRRDHVLFDNGRFKVTPADISTPTVYYPVDATTGRIRRDIAWCAGAYSVVTGIMLYAYADLWRFSEMVGIAASIALAVWLGRSFSILQIDARGFPPRMFVARSTTIRELFSAISAARAMRASPGGGLDELEESNNE